MNIFDDCQSYNELGTPFTSKRNCKPIPPFALIVIVPSPTLQSVELVTFTFVITGCCGPANTTTGFVTGQVPSTFVTIGV